MCHLAGRQLSLKKVSNMWLRGTDTVAAQFICRTFGKPSGPVEVLCLKRLNITNTSAGIQLTLDRLHDSTPNRSVLASDPLSVVNTEPKKLLKLSACSSDSSV